MGNSDNNAEVVESTWEQRRRRGFSKLSSIAEFSGCLRQEPKEFCSISHGSLPGRSIVQGVGKRSPTVIERGNGRW
uniref:Uncharacterized protein n=1 Tax=Steinernema glaseri TaxID=37863 RepID=A0A1I7YU27_9BILA